MGNKGGTRAGSGRKANVSLSPPAEVVSSRVGAWAIPTLEENAKLNDLSLSAYVGQVLERSARAKGAEPPTKYKSPRHRHTGHKRPSRAARAAAECAPDAPCSYTIEGGRCSVTGAVIVPARGGGLGIEKIPARYCLIEAKEIKTSHNPLGGFAPTRGYPADAQERDYGLQIEQGKVHKIAQNYEPSLIFSTAPGALDGLPVATEERFVLGGNGRAMATMLVYAGEGGTAANVPRDYLLANARQFGFTVKDVKKFKQPMIVRTIRTGDSSPRTLAEWSRRLNASLSQQLDPVTLAVSRAKFISPQVLEHLEAIGPDETLSEYLSSERSLSFVRALQAAGVIDSRSAQLYLNRNGLLNADGRALLLDVLVARIVPNAPQLTAIGPQAVETLSRSAYYLVSTEKMGAYNLLVPMRAVIADVLDLRNSGLTLKRFLAEGNLFSKRSPLQETLLEIFVGLQGSPEKFFKVTRRYLQLAKVAQQPSLFGSQSPGDALRDAADEVKFKFL